MSVKLLVKSSRNYEKVLFHPLLNCFCFQDFCDFCRYRDISKICVSDFLSWVSENGFFEKVLYRTLDKLDVSFLDRLEELYFSKDPKELLFEIHKHIKEQYFQNIVSVSRTLTSFLLNKDFQINSSELMDYITLRKVNEDIWILL